MMTIREPLFDPRGPALSRLVINWRNIAITLKTPEKGEWKRTLAHCLLRQMAKLRVRMQGHGDTGSLA